MALSVPLPCSVKIANARIRDVYYFCMLAVLSFCIWNFIANRGGTIKLSNAPQVFIVYGLNTLPQALKYDRSTDRRCIHPEKKWSEYKLGPKIYPPFTKIFQRFTCSYLVAGSCPPVPNMNTCADLYETGSPASPFDLKVIVTDTFKTLGPNATLETGPLGPTEMAVDTYFYVFSQVYDLKFSYQFMLENSPPNFFGLNAGIRQIGTHRDARTVLLGANGLPVQTFAAGQDILVPLTRVLQFSQGPREVNRRTLNQLKHFPSFSGDATSFPSWLWDVGCTIYAIVNCYSDDFDIASNAGRLATSEHDMSVWELGATSAHPVCVLRLTLVKTSSIDIDTQTKEPGLTVRHERFSLRVIGKPGTSFFRARDANATLIFITSALVLLGLPQKLMRVVVLHCLGQLSKVYQSVIAKDFDVHQHCARAVMQLVSQSSSFVQLADQCNPEMEPGLSRQRLLECVQAVVANRRSELDDAEIEVLVSFVFAQLLNDKAHRNVFGFDYFTSGFGRRRVWHEGPGSAAAKPALKGDSKGSSSDEPQEKGQEQHEDESVEVVDIESFCRTTGNEALSVNTIVGLFDRDRRYCLGERLFMPADLWHVIHCNGDCKEEITDSSTAPVPELKARLTKQLSSRDQHTQQDFTELTKQLSSQDQHTQQDFTDLAPRIERIEAELSTCSAKMKLFSAELQDLRSKTQGIGERHAAAVATIDMELGHMKQKLHDVTGGLKTAVIQAPIQSSCGDQDASPCMRALSFETSDRPQDAVSRSDLAKVQEACAFAVEQAMELAVAAAGEMAREVATVEAVRLQLNATPTNMRTEQRIRSTRPSSRDKHRIATTAMQAAVDNLALSHSALIQAVGQQSTRMRHIELQLMEQSAQLSSATR